MLLPKQRKLRNPMSSARSKEPELSKGLVSLITIIVLIVFILYVQVFHAALQYRAIKVVEAGPPPQQLLVPSASVHQQQSALRPKEEPAAVERHVAETNPTGKEVFTLKTDEGDIHIVLRTDLSPESADYIRALFKSGVCDRCNLYRAERPGILQGVMKSKDIHVSKVKGICPAGSEKVPNDCPGWDKSCGCHGPVMKRGMVGWAAGQMGPDFFIDNYKRPGEWWGTQHTIWGEIQDAQSLALVHHIIMDLPNEHRKDMTFLKKSLHFEMELTT